MQDGCKVYMDSYMASNGSCFMVTWTIFKNHLLEASLTQTPETMALRMFTAVDLLYFVVHDDPHEQKFNEVAFNEGLVTSDFHIYVLASNKSQQKLIYAPMDNYESNYGIVEAPILDEDPIGKSQGNEISIKPEPILT